MKRPNVGLYYLIWRDFYRNPERQYVFRSFQIQIGWSFNDPTYGNATVLSFRKSKSKAYKYLFLCKSKQQNFESENRNMCYFYDQLVWMEEQSSLGISNSLSDNSNGVEYNNIFFCLLKLWRNDQLEATRVKQSIVVHW